MRRSRTGYFRKAFQRWVPGIVLLGLSCLLPGVPVAAQSFPTPVGNLGAKTCQQLWYVEQQVLSEGRVCLRTERARRAFRRAERCISPDEDILPSATRTYLAELRATARRKGCRGF